MTLFDVFDRLCDSYMRQIPLVWFFEVEAYLVNFRKNEKDICLHIFGESLGSKVLVYHCRNPGQRSVHILDNGYTAASGCYYYC